MTPLCPKRRIFHNWTKWHIYAEGEVVETHIPTRLKGVKARLIIQQRTCTNCGFIQLKKVHS